MSLALGVDGRIRAVMAALGQTVPDLQNGDDVFIGLLGTLPATYLTDSLEDLVTGNELAMASPTPTGFYTGRVLFPWGAPTELGGYAEARVDASAGEGGWMNQTGSPVVVEGMFLTDSNKSFTQAGDDANGKVLAVGPVSGSPLTVADDQWVKVRHLSIGLRVVA